MLKFSGLLLALALLSQTQSAVAQDTLFSITHDDVRNLRYLQYRNVFDYSGVDYRIGEFRLKNSEGMQRIKFASWPSQKSVIHGSPVQGVDHSLLPAGRSEDFTINGPEPNTLEFFREVGLFAPSNAFPDLPPKNEEPGYVPTPWDVLDLSEWVVRVLRSSDDEHLFTLDSAGVAAHSDPQQEARYGTSSTKVKHAVALPQSLIGENVYLQIVPKRVGPTAFGMHIFELYNWVNYSLTYNDYGGRIGNDAALRQVYYDKVVEHFDAVKIATGWIPQTRYLQLTDEQYKDLERRYMDPQVEGGDTLWYEHNTRPQSVISRTPQADGSMLEKVVEISTISIRNLSPQPLSGKCLTVELEVMQAMTVTLELANIAGRRLQELWQGPLVAGKHKIAVELDSTDLAGDLAGDLAAATYLLMARSADGGSAAGSPLQINP